MGTLTHVFALPCSPERGRRPTVTARVANFGVHRSRRADYDPSDPQSVLARVLFGFDEEGATPWAVHPPDEVLDVRGDVVRAIALATATAVANPDDYADWFASQLREADQVLTHASRHREWVVSVFEGDVPCFLRGGTPRHEPGDPLFEPHCAIPAESEPEIELPLGIAAGLVLGFGIVGWRYRRLSRR